MGHCLKDSQLSFHHSFYCLYDKAFSSTLLTRALDQIQEQQNYMSHSFSVYNPHKYHCIFSSQIVHEIDFVQLFLAPPK